MDYIDALQALIDIEEKEDITKVDALRICEAFILVLGAEFAETQQYKDLKAAADAMTE